MGDLSPHFSRSEFRCHHCGALPGRPAQRLLDGLEVVRQNHGGPVRIVSGYRCPVHNKRIGGASSSRHMANAAADLEPGVLSTKDAKIIGFDGIGDCRGWAVHVDIRPGGQVVFPDC